MKRQYQRLVLFHVFLFSWDTSLGLLLKLGCGWCSEIIVGSEDVVNWDRGEAYSISCKMKACEKGYRVQECDVNSSVQDPYFLARGLTACCFVQYDLYTTSYSPDGRVFQVEYANKAVEASG